MLLPNDWRCHNFYLSLLIVDKNYSPIGNVIDNLLIVYFSFVITVIQGKRPCLDFGYHNEGPFNGRKSLHPILKITSGSRKIMFPSCAKPAINLRVCLDGGKKLEGRKLKGNKLGGKKESGFVFFIGMFE